VFEEFGLRESQKTDALSDEERVVITFHLGFMDELPPQTGVWIEDAEGEFIRSLYVSGFSGFAKEKQVNLPAWAESSKFETDGTTSASIGWGKHTYVWDLKNREGKRVPDGTYRVRVESAWWPSMKYGRISADIPVGSSNSEITVAKPPFIPRLHVQYIE
jgi:hypothetical protein